MTDMGAFALIALLVWCAFLLLFTVTYRLVRSFFFRVIPEHGCILLLCWWSAPLILSFFSSLLMYLPILDHVTVAPHCHTNMSCESHMPVTNGKALAWFGIGLLAALGATVIYQLINYLKTVKRLTQQLHVLGKKSENEKASIYQLDNAHPLVFTLGLWHPKIYMTTALRRQCTAEEINIIIEHECAHRDRRDNLRLLLGRLLTLLIPQQFSKQILNDLHILTEQACDRAAATKYSNLCVAQALIKVTKLVKESPPTVFSALAFANNAVELRIRLLLKDTSLYQLDSFQWGMGAIVFTIMMLLLISPLHFLTEWTFQ